jgi:hypothetical protein
MPGFLEPAEYDIKGKSGEEGFSMAKKVPTSKPSIEYGQATHSQAAKPPRSTASEPKNADVIEQGRNVPLHSDRPVSVQSLKLSDEKPQSAKSFGARSGSHKESRPAS